MADKQSRLKILMIGPKDSGKTVFISNFVNCATLTIGSDSVKYLKLNWNKLAAGERVFATASMFKDMTFSYKGNIDGRDFNVDLIIPDYDGQFAEKLSSAGKDYILDGGIDSATTG